jgi:YegS/Rv2252/BmrU family lipid kinase
MSAADVPRWPAAFVVNPAAGGARARAGRVARIEAFIRRARLDATVQTSRRGGHAAELAREAVERGARLVVSVGGDGTMNEVARAVAGTGVLYGMVPCGSGNGLARDLGIPLDAGKALAALVEGVVREIDAGEVNGLPFFNVMGLGFDAEIGRRFNLCARRGFVSYLRIGVRTYLAYRRERLEIEPEGGAPVEVDAFLAAVANSTQYGNGARIAPGARLDDGRLDLAAVAPRSIAGALGIVGRLFAGTVDRSRWVRTFQAPRFRIRRAAPGPVHTDGEVHDCGAELDVAVRPRALRVVVPRSG